jgi:hypothetical protein
MSLPKVSIDLPLILEPYKLSLVLSGLDVFYSEIIVPDSVQFVEVWNKQMMPITLHTFKDDLKEYQRPFGLDDKKIEPDNFIAGLSLLQKAYQKGMISLFQTDKFVADGQDFLHTDKYFNQFYNVLGDKYVINTDMPITLEGMLGYELNTGTKAIFGDDLFAKYLNGLRIYEDLQTADLLEKDKNLEFFLKSPQSSSVDELIEFVLNKHFYEQSALKIFSSKSLLERNKDIALNTLEFSSTLMLDTMAFNGLPISSGVAFAYKIGKRIFKRSL